MSDFDKVGLLTRRDMELEAQLDGITNKAVKAFQKRDPSPEPVPINRKPADIIFTNTPQAIADLELKDMAFEIESEKLTNRAVGAVKNVKPQVVKSHITKEMIEDYQIEQSNPIKFCSS